MNTRLQCLANMIEDSLIVADIGTDHAHLPIDLIKSGSVSRAIASDIGSGPLATARANVTAHGLTEQIELRLGSGLAPYQLGEVDVFVIAGMGGHTIVDILADDAVKARAARYLLLQPMQNRPFLRQYLYDNAYQIVREVVVRENNKFYHIIKVIAQAAVKPNKFEISFGTNVDKDDNYFAYLEHLIVQKSKLASHLKSAGKDVEYKRISRELEQLKGAFDARNR